MKSTVSIRQKCKFCGSMFTKRRLRQHVRKEHKESTGCRRERREEKRSETFDPELKFKCSCGDRFETKMHLERHILQDRCGATIYGCSVSILLFLCDIDSNRRTKKNLNLDHQDCDYRTLYLKDLLLHTEKKH